VVGGQRRWWLLGVGGCGLLAATTMMLQWKIMQHGKKELTGFILNKRLKKIDCGDCREFNVGG